MKTGVIKSLLLFSLFALTFNAQIFSNNNISENISQPEFGPRPAGMPNLGVTESRKNAKPISTRKHRSRVKPDLSLTTASMPEQITISSHTEPAKIAPIAPKAADQSTACPVEQKPVTSPIKPVKIAPPLPKIKPAQRLKAAQIEKKQNAACAAEQISEASSIEPINIAPQIPEMPQAAPIIPKQEEDIGKTWPFQKKFLYDTKKTRKKLLKNGFRKIEIPLDGPSAKAEISQEQAAAIAEQIYPIFKKLVQNPNQITKDEMKIVGPLLQTAQNNPNISQIIGYIQGNKQTEAINGIAKIIIETVQNEENQQNDSYSQRKLNALFLERPNARATIIFSPGFWPGEKEKFAPFIKIAPKDCNLLFLEFSGHGENSGAFYLETLKLLFNISSYSISDYNELIACTSYTASTLAKNKPIILFGWCAGGFVAAKALTKLKEMSTPENDLIKMLNIKGLIIDSGFGAIKDVAPKIGQYIKEQKLKCLKPTDNNVGICSWLGGTVGFVLNFIKKGIAGTAQLIIDILVDVTKPGVNNQEETNIFNKIASVADTNILFIHSKDDVFTAISNAKKLHNSVKAANPQNDDFLETEGNCHATNHLKHKEIYKARLKEWLIKVVGPEIPQPGEPEKKENPEKPTKDKEQTKDGQVKNKNIERMIKIIDKIIEIVDSGALEGNEKESARKEVDDLGKEFFTLLQNPESNIPDEAKALIVQKFQELEKSSLEKKPKEDQIRILKEIKNILLDLNPTQMSKENSLEKDNAKRKEMDNKEKFDPKRYFGNTPEDKKNNEDSKKQGSESKKNDSNYSPSRSDYSGPDSRNYGSPSSNNAKGISSSGPKNYGGSGGYGNMDWSPSHYDGNANNQNQNDEEKKPVLTESEFLRIDPDYDQDPEMKDKPDKKGWFF